jgi:hypothetical protein
MVGRRERESGRATGDATAGDATAARIDPGPRRVKARTSRAMSAACGRLVGGMWAAPLARVICGR